MALNKMVFFHEFMIYSTINVVITRVGGITRSASARRREGDRFGARHKPRHS